LEWTELGSLFVVGRIANFFESIEEKAREEIKTAKEAVQGF
jgi:hypothetical protein